MSDDKKTKDDAKKKIASSLSGAIDPEIRVAGEQFGSWLASVIPSDSWLRSKGAERVFGILRQWAEANVEKLGPIGSAVGEKFTDLLDHASGEIFGLGTEKHSGGKPASTVEKAVDGWMNEFFKDAGIRIKKAKPEELDLLSEHLQKEFAVRKRLLEMLKEEFKKPEAKKPEACEETKGKPSINWGKKLKRFHRGWRSFNGEWSRWLEENTAALEVARDTAKKMAEARKTGSQVVYTRGPEIAVIIPPVSRADRILTALNRPWRFLFKLFFGSPKESLPSSAGTQSVPADTN